MPRKVLITKDTLEEILAKYQGGSSDTLVNAPAQTITNVTYQQLVTLKNNSGLIPGNKYRIIDYVTTFGNGTLIYQGMYIHLYKSAEHQFDIIVTALSENTLSSNAKATIHEGDTYFANSDLDSWELKYDVNNDTTKYSFASATGKGVIYWMKDEFNNECEYDFKNLMYLTYYCTYSSSKQTSLASTNPEYPRGRLYNGYIPSSEILTMLFLYYMTAQESLETHGEEYQGTVTDVLNDLSYWLFKVTKDADLYCGADTILGTTQFSSVNSNYEQTFLAKFLYTFPGYDNANDEEIDLSITGRLQNAKITTPSSVDNDIISRLFNNTKLLPYVIVGNNAGNRGHYNLDLIKNITVDNSFSVFVELDGYDTAFNIDIKRCDNCLFSIQGNALKSINNHQFIDTKESVISSHSSEIKANKIKQTYLETVEAFVNALDIKGSFIYLDAANYKTEMQNLYGINNSIIYNCKSVDLKGMSGVNIYNSDNIKIDGLTVDTLNNKIFRLCEASYVTIKNCSDIQFIDNSPEWSFINSKAGFYIITIEDSNDITFTTDSFYEIVLEDRRYYSIYNISISIKDSHDISLKNCQYIDIKNSNGITIDGTYETQQETEHINYVVNVNIVGSSNIVCYGNSDASYEAHVSSQYPNNVDIPNRIEIKDSANVTIPKYAYDVSFTKSGNITLAKTSGYYIANLHFYEVVNSEVTTMSYAGVSQNQKLSYGANNYPAPKYITSQGVINFTFTN